MLKVDIKGTAATSKNIVVMAMLITLSAFDPINYFGCNSVQYYFQLQI